MFGASGPTHCECGPNADWFVQKWFSDCIYTTWELAAFWIGMSSVLFWIVAQLPQFITNLKNQTAEALSPWFLFQWLAGDSFNLLGCILTGDQLATQTFTAIYFICADCVIISQFLYYSMREEERVTFEETDQGSSSFVRDSVAKAKDSLKDTFLEFQKQLPKIIIVVPELSEDEAQHDGHQEHLVPSVTGPSTTSQALHSPRALHSPDVEHDNKVVDNGVSTSSDHSPERGRPHGKSPQQNPNSQNHHVTFWTGRSAASMISHVLHSPNAPHNPHVDHFSRTSQTSTDRGLERGGSTEVDLQGNPDAQCQTSGASKGRDEALLGRSDRRKFQLVRELNQHNRMSAARLGTIPEITVEQLFYTANEMKRRLRRLVNQYGLECGPPSVSRRTIHHAKSLQKHDAEKLMGGTSTSKLGSGLKRGPVKAAACLAALLTVGTSSNFFQKSGTSGPPQVLSKGSRRLLLATRYPDPTGSISTESSTVKIGRRLLLICGDAQRPWWLRSLGNCLGWGSSGLYFGSRFSQIIMNYKRRSAEGLSLAMVSCAVLANTSMGVSILMRAKSLDDLINKAPWLLGSMGTVSLDLLILLQAKYLDSRCSKSSQTVPNERTYLLA